MAPVKQLRYQVKIKESLYIALFVVSISILYIALFVVSISINKLFSIDYENIYLFSIFFSIDFAVVEG